MGRGSFIKIFKGANAETIVDELPIFTSIESFLGSSKIVLLKEFIELLLRR